MLVRKLKEYPASILGDTGADRGGEGKSNEREKNGAKKT